ncbi:zinc finger matrin-type protein 1 isoform X2 [Melanotaenia boesemani]|uniref:zinc finger matrin-type protein 1 isoform X2 n=1 Tax=Melanotaenia boesemani TaxID=1250792 RepID=UPI001C04A297|nr:zinc finger matrin-type protein 1 isoform X2 [Melanotaenia boesemani]
MEDSSVCIPQTAESDPQNNTASTPNAASVVDLDKVINTKIDSTQVEGERSDEELLKGLLTDNYCHVCCSELLFESHRLSHYKGKKHAQKVRVFLNAVRTEKAKGSQTMPNDKNRFCELCNMVFSSHVVAKSHYEGKVHAKNLRKQSLHPPDRDPEACTSPSLTQDPDKFDQKSSPEGDTELCVDPTDDSASPSTDVALTDPKKYCSLCAASFNNPQMAFQHYNGRKHQRIQARQDLLKELGEDVQQASYLMCHMCGVLLHSVETYQAHMQGNKHQIREKKISDLFKSQPKVYSTFADELADYIQVQKARGITPKANQVLPQDGTQKEDANKEEENQEELAEWDMIETNQAIPSNSNPSHMSHPGMWHPPYPGPPWPPHGRDFNCPPPLLQCSVSSQSTSWPTNSRRQRRLSSSSTYTTSSSTTHSSDSTLTSDSEASEHRPREKRRVLRTKRDRGRKGGDEVSEKGERRKKRRRQESDYDSEEKGREQSVDSEEEARRKKLKIHGKWRRQERKHKQENFEAVKAERQMETLQPEHTAEDRNETEVHLQSDFNIEQSDSGHDKPTKPKYRKEKKKTKERVDTRTEEEKLWDDSILGC